MSVPNVYEGRMLRTAGICTPPLWQWDTLCLPSGLTLVLGDEGRGKTLLLRTLAGELPKACANAQVAQHSLHHTPKAYRQEVAWLDPASNTWDSTVVDDFWTQQAAQYPRWNRPRLDFLIDAWSLTAHRAKPLYMLSTGSRRKALMAAALASDAALTLLDMPFAALDGAASRCLREVLTQCAQQPHRAVVLADYSLPAGVQANHILNLDAFQ
jgi:ABC-type multidrug transport system ATPase subunit